MKNNCLDSSNITKCNVFLNFQKSIQIDSTFIKYTIYKNQREKYVILSIDLIHAVKRVPEAKKSLSCMRFKVYISVYTQQQRKI